MTGGGGSTIVITGGTRGLGRALALEFGRAGYTVLALYASDRDAAEALSLVFREEGIEGRVVQHDVTCDADAADVWRAPELEEASDLGLIHNAAAPFTPQPMHLVGWDEVQRTMDVALGGCWQSIRGLLRPMLRTGRGTIVSVLTRALEPPPPKGFSAYRAAKAAQRALVESVVAEYGARGLRGFSVAPGFMQTTLTDAWHPGLVDAASGEDGASLPSDVAGRVRALYEDANLPAAGESYDV